MSTGKNSTLRFNCSVLLFVIYGLLFVSCRTSEHEIEKYVLQMVSTNANDRALAVKYLREVGALAIPNLIVALDSQDLTIRANVVWLLGEIGEPVEQMVFNFDISLLFLGTILLLLRVSIYLALIPKRVICSLLVNSNNK